MRSVKRVTKCGEITDLLERNRRAPNFLEVSMGGERSRAFGLRVVIAVAVDALSAERILRAFGNWWSSDTGVDRA